MIDSACHGWCTKCFFTPARHLAAGQNFADIVAGLDEGIVAAEARRGARACSSATWTAPWGPRPGASSSQDSSRSGERVHRERTA